MKILISEVQAKVVGTLSKNFSEDDARKIAEVLLWADQSGVKTQGLGKMLGSEPVQGIKPLHELRVEKDTKISQLINAGSNPAQLASQIATDVAIEKAKEHGVGIVGVHNFFSSNGTQAFYANKIAKNDLVAMVCSRSPASVNAFGGIDPIFGTNPIGFAFPTKSEPLVVDMASSAMTWYGLVLAKLRGEKIPENMAIDKSGNPTIDPEAAMDGALLPFDRSYKGASIDMVIELLAGPLVGAGYGKVGGEWGALFIAIDPNIFSDLDTFKTHCSELIELVKAARTKNEGDVIRIPGERALLARREAELSGMVEIDESILKELGYL